MHYTKSNVHCTPILCALISAIKVLQETERPIQQPKKSLRAHNMGTLCPLCCGIVLARSLQCDGLTRTLQETQHKAIILLQSQPRSWDFDSCFCLLIIVWKAYNILRATANYYFHAYNIHKYNSLDIKNSQQVLFNDARNDWLRDGPLLQ